MAKSTKDPLKIAGTVFLSLLSITVLIGLFKTGEMKLNVNSTTHPDAKTITVSGEGSVVVKPDVAKISVSVVSEDKVINRVIDDGNDKMNAITKKLKEIGMSSDDITTSGYYLYPQYKYPQNESPTISGYRLEQTLALTIRDLEMVDDVIDAATNLGANNIYGLTFTLDDDTEVMNEAREKAFAAAKEKAQRMADAAGVNLGDVYTFYEGYGANSPVYYYTKSEAAYGGIGGGGGSTIESGSQEYTVTVNMTYEIE